MKKLALLGAFAVIVATFIVMRQQPGSGGGNSWGGAMWVWDQPETHHAGQSNDPCCLRCTFDLDDRAPQADLWISADHQYVVYVNGQQVGAGSDWESAEFYHVAEYLVAGKNVLAIKATNQEEAASVIARLHVKTADNRDLFIVTNEKTKICRMAPSKAVSEDWTRAEYDDSAWQNATMMLDDALSWREIVDSVASVLE